MPKIFSSQVDSGSDEVELELPFQIFPEPVCNHVYNVYISSPIIETGHYDKLFHLLRTINPTDQVNLYIGSDGGDVSTGLALISAMRDCPALITTILNPHALSMAAVLFLAGDAQVVPSNGLLMFHDYSSNSDMGAKGNEQIAAVQASRAWFSHILNDVCYPFLSKSEIKAITEGKDLWLQADEIRNRLKVIQDSAKKKR